ncbi:hypothetical protein V6N12_059637 [Hibiscus sabdariffa]|uniref:Uncharacterized protein n=1 Tax=Hibiscus sabdariffa TaxID=183260 RepID=A0ABR2EVN2_9ROSI
MMDGNGRRFLRDNLSNSWGTKSYAASNGSAPAVNAAIVGLLRSGNTDVIGDETRSAIVDHLKTGGNTLLSISC